MRTFVFIALLGLIALTGYVKADCGDENAKESGETTTWFKKLGCNIQKGAKDLQETAKPWTDKISDSAKEFGKTVANKYGEIKHKLSDDEQIAASSTPLPIYDAPMEKVPLAPIGGVEAPTPATAPIPTPAQGVPGEPRSYPTVPPVTPKSIDDRFLFQLNECPAGEVKDHTGHCRKAV